MGKLAELIVKVGADISDFTKGMDKTTKSMEQMASKMSSIGSSMSTFITLPILGAAAASVKLASDLNESINKVDVAFGASSQAVKTWSENTLTQFGLAQGTSMDMAAKFGDMATSMGFTQSAAAGMSTSMVGLAADLASFKNISIDMANTALTSVFTGETESLKQLGIVMTQANLQEYALSQGIKTKVNEMSQAAQVQLRYNYVLEMTKNAQGDFIRTGGGAANQMRIFGESLKELGQTFGQVVLPVFTPLITKLNQMLQKFKDISPESKKIIVLFVGLAAALGPLIFMVSKAIEAFLAFKKVLMFLGISSGPIGWVIIAIGALITAGVLLYTHWDKVKYYALQTWSTIKTTILDAAAKIAEGLGKLTGAVGLDSLSAKAKAAAADIRGAIALEGQISNKRKTEYYTVGAGAPKAPETPIMPNFEMPNVDYSSKGADKAAKAAKDVKAAWESTAEVLSAKLQTTAAAMDIAMNSAMVAGDKTLEFGIKSKYLSDQIALQKQVIDAVNEGYIRGLNNTKLTAEEKENLRLKVEQERKALSDLEVQMWENTQAQKEMASSLADLAARAKEARDKFNTDMAAALADYQAKCEEVNNNLIADEKRVNDEFEAALAQRANALSNFVGLFDAVQPKQITGDQLLVNLQGQVATFDQWQSDIASLANKGINEGLLTELRAMGPSAASEIAALNNLSAPQLDQYVSLWQQKSNMARASAAVELENQRQETLTKIDQLRAEAATKLEQYKVEWQKKNTEIRQNTLKELDIIAKEYEKITGKSFQQGAVLVKNFANGMESQFDYLQAKIEQMYEIVGAGSPSVTVSSSGSVSVPAMASGGLVTKPTIALIGEAGPEAVVPLNRGGSFAAGGNNIEININGVQDPEEICRYIERKLALAGVS